jgi:ADP-ribose pyrophosphatase
MKWSILKQRLLYQGFFKLTEFELQHELFAGGESQVIRRELLDRHHAAGILPYDPVRDEMVLVEQFRIGAVNQRTDGPWLIEVIAGYREPGETPEAVVAREAIEEAGCKISDIEPICRYYTSPGSSNEQIHLYIGRCETTGLGGIHGLAHEGEDIRVHVVSSQTAFDWLDDGRIDNSMAIITLQWFRHNRESLRRRWLESD